MKIELNLKVTDNKKEYTGTHRTDVDGVSDAIDFLEKYFRTAYFSWLSKLPVEIVSKLKENKTKTPKNKSSEESDA